MVKKVGVHLDMFTCAIPLATACTGLILHAIYQQRTQNLSEELIWLLDGDRAEFRQASSQEPQVQAQYWTPVQAAVELLLVKI